MNNRDEIIYNKIKQVIIILDEIDEMINSQSEELQKVDYVLSDWLHYIENNEINEKNSIKIIKEMQKLRKQRRCLHNEYEIEKTYKNNSLILKNKPSFSLDINHILCQYIVY